MLKCNANNSCYRVKKKKKKKNHVSVCFELSCVLSFLFTFLIGFHLSKKKTFLIGFLVSINFQIYLTFSTVI